MKEIRNRWMGITLKPFLLLKQEQLNQGVCELFLISFSQGDGIVLHRKSKT